MKKYITDTNFILRYLLADNKEQYKTAKTIFDQTRDGRVQIKLEQSVFVEVIFVLSSFYKIPKNKLLLASPNLLLSPLKYLFIKKLTHKF